MIYCVDSRALAMAEVVVRLPFYLLPQDFEMIEISIPDTIKIKTVTQKELPEMWNGFPYHPKTQSIGNDFIKANEYAVLKVPSAVVQGDFNFLLNPFHKHFKRINIKSHSPFVLDKCFFE